jgi:hypothetical protein
MQTRRITKSERYFDFDNPFFDARVVVWLEVVVVGVYNLFYRSTALCVQKLRSNALCRKDVLQPIYKALVYSCPR